MIPLLMRSEIERLFWVTGEGADPFGTVSSRHFLGRWLRRKGPTKKKKP